MRIISTLIAGTLVMVWSVQALARPAPVVLSAGEHGTYSRIAIPAGDDTAWSAIQDGATITITLPGLSGPVNINAVYPRRAAHRVLNAAVTQIGSVTILKIDLACDCTAKIYRWKGSKILIDIQARTASRSQTAISTNNPPTNTGNPPSQEFAPLDIEKARANLRERLQAAAEAGVVQMEGAVPVKEPTAKPEPSEAAPSEKNLAMAETAEKSLTQPVAPDAPASPTGTDHAIPSPSDAGDGHRNGHADLPAQDTDDPVTATNIMYGHDVNLQTRKFCLPDTSLKLGDWRSADPFAKELSRQRTALLGEFDVPNEMAAVALAKFYLAHGLGEEAALVLSQFVRPEHAEAGLLADLAAIFRRRKVSVSGPVLGAEDCEGAHALWQAAALALNAHWHDSAQAEKRSGDTLAQLPRDIRVPLGVHIAEAALNAGQMEQVRRILALLRRSGTIKSPELDLIEGKFALSEKRNKRAHALLDPLSRSVHPQAVEAILALSRAELIEPGYLSEDRLVDLSLIAMERRYTPLGRQALILTASAEAAAGRPATALDLLSREADASALATEKSELRKEISKTLLGLYKAGPGEPSLQDTDLFWRYESYLGADITTRAIRRGAARHFLAKGLPNAALKLLRAPGTEEGPPLLLAEALVATNRPGQALAALKPFAQDPQTLTLRSQALTQLGKSAEAARLISGESRSPDLLKLKAGLLWSNGEWENAARVYIRLSGTLPADEQAAVDRRMVAATYMANDEALTRDTLSRLQEGGNKDLIELLAPSLSRSLPLPERVDQSLAIAQTVNTILKELLADG